ARLGGAFLNGASLREADLRGAYVRVARLDGADLSAADLRGSQGLVGDQLATALRLGRPARPRRHMVPTAHPCMSDRVEASTDQPCRKGQMGPNLASNTVVSSMRSRT